MNKSLLHDLLGPLHMHFLGARTAYRNYLENKRKFLFAVSLRRINLGARSLLMNKGYLLPQDLQEDAAALVAHYDAWLTLWTRHRAEVRPEPEDPFVFENSFTYPRESEIRLEALYAQLAAESRGETAIHSP